jgi:rhodanese-related sulfurtransferase
MTAIREINPLEAAARLAEFRVIDVRGESEFSGPLGHVAGATLIPLPTLAQRAAEIPRGRPLLLICRSGARSAKACAQLAELGVGPAVNLVGGMIAWHRAELVVERARPASLAQLLESAVFWLAQVTAQTPEAAREKLRTELAEDLLASPTHAGISRALDAIQRLAGSPPDLDLSLVAFRSALAAL